MADEIIRRLEELRAGQGRIVDRLGGMEGRLAGMEGRFAGVETRLGGMEALLGSVDRRLTLLERLVVDLQKSTNDNFTMVLDTLQHLGGSRAARRAG